MKLVCAPLKCRRYAISCLLASPSELQYTQMRACMKWAAACVCCQTNAAYAASMRVWRVCVHKRQRPRMQHRLCHMQPVSSISSCVTPDACVCTLPAGSHRLQQRPCSVWVWCHCRVQSPAAIVTAVILLGAGWAVPYYVPLPAYNLRKGGSFSAVLEGIVSLLSFQRLPLNEHAVDIKLIHQWVSEGGPPFLTALPCLVNMRQDCCCLIASDLVAAVMACSAMLKAK